MRTKKLYANLFKNYSLSKFDTNQNTKLINSFELYFAAPENTDAYLKDLIGYLTLSFGVKPKMRFKKISKTNPFNQLAYYSIKPGFNASLSILDKTAQVLLPNLENYLTSPFTELKKTIKKQYKRPRSHLITV